MLELAAVMVLCVSMHIPVARKCPCTSVYHVDASGKERGETSLAVIWLRGELVAWQGQAGLINMAFNLIWVLQSWYWVCELWLDTGMKSACGGILLPVYLPSNFQQSTSMHTFSNLNPIRLVWSYRYKSEEAWDAFWWSYSVDSLAVQWVHTMHAPLTSFAPARERG